MYDFSLSGTGIPTEPINANFFFIDIVGLSDPLLSVNKQREKIETLNSLILTCEAFKADDKKIILPTGDGMVIGFPLNPELPLQLGMDFTVSCVSITMRKIVMTRSLYVLVSVLDQYLQ